MGSILRLLKDPDDLGTLLSGLPPKARDALRRVLIRDQDVTRFPLGCSATATDMATTGPTSSTC
jgi:hypothetical protein